MDIQFSAVTNSKVTVGNTSTLVLAPNSGRAYVLLVNDSDETMYLALGEAAVLNSGIPLVPHGGALEIVGDKPWLGSIYGISTSGSKNLAYFEGIGGTS